MGRFRSLVLFLWILALRQEAETEAETGTQGCFSHNMHEARAGYGMYRCTSYGIVVSAATLKEEERYH